MLIASKDYTSYPMTHGDTFRAEFTDAKGIEYSVEIAITDCVFPLERWEVVQGSSGYAKFKSDHPEAADNLYLNVRLARRGTLFYQKAVQGLLERHKLRSDLKFLSILKNTDGGGLDQWKSTYSDAVTGSSSPY